MGRLRDDWKNSENNNLANIFEYFEEQIDENVQKYLSNYWNVLSW